MTDIGDGLRQALEAVEMGNDREYGWALDLAEEVRKFAVHHGFTGLPPEGSGVLLERKIAAERELFLARHKRADTSSQINRICDSVDEVATDYCRTQWPQAEEGEYDPRCCRYPKSCSAPGRGNG